MWKRIKYGGDGLPYNYSEFICESDSDLNTLPTNSDGVKYRCSIGSKAFTINKNYILNLSNEWVEDLFEY